MPLIVDKILSVVIFPLGLTIFTGLFLLLIGALGWRKSSIGLLAGLLLGLWGVSTPIFAAFALATLENDFPRRALQGLPTAPVAIVLGGGIRPAGSRRPDPDLADGSDRLVSALRLLRTGKVSKILLAGTGNGFVYGTRQVAGPMAGFLADFGIEPSVILIESQSRNTYENAVFARKIWDREGFRSAILITSAYHMRRAHRVFALQGLNVTAHPVDFRAESLESLLPLSILPSVNALEQTTVVVKEWIGLWIYWLRGWA